MNRVQKELRGVETNAGALHVGDALTEDQIIALGRMEGAFTNARGGWVRDDVVEDVLHAFVCVAMNDCVCVTPKALS